MLDPIVRSRDVDITARKKERGREDLGVGRAIGGYIKERSMGSEWAVLLLSQIRQHLALRLRIQGGRHHFTEETHLQVPMEMALQL